MNFLTSDRWLIPIAFVIIYVVWGSTYLANWYAVQEIPPFIMAGARFFTAGLLLFVASFAFGAKKPTTANWKAATECGFLFFLIGNGGAVWALQFIDSGIEALVISSQPLVTVLLMWQMLGQRPSWHTLVGVGIGMVGMFLLVSQDAFVSGDNALLGFGAIMLAVVSWGIATIRIAKLPLPKMKTQSAGMQMIMGGVLLLLLGLVFGEAKNLHLATLTNRAIGSWFYLVLLGSVVAFSAFNYLLLKSTPDKVSTTAYINPVVALLLGWWLNNEVISTQSSLAAGLMIAGVVFITRKKEVARCARPVPLASLITEFGETTTEIDLPPPTSPDNLVARIWHGQASEDSAAKYVDWAKNKVVPCFTAQDGNLGMTLHRRTEGEVSYLTFVSYWENMEAVKRFRGKDFESAMLFPEEREMLLGFEEKVEHRDVSGQG